MSYRSPSDQQRALRCLVSICQDGLFLFSQDVSKDLPEVFQVLELSDKDESQIVFQHKRQDVKEMLYVKLQLLPAVEVDFLAERKEELVVEVERENELEETAKYDVAVGEEGEDNDSLQSSCKFKSDEIYNFVPAELVENQQDWE